MRHLTSRQIQLISQIFNVILTGRGNVLQQGGECFLYVMKRGIAHDNVFTWDVNLLL